MVIGDHGQYFCHYTTADTAFRHILPSGRIQLSPYSRMRDPLEAKAWHMAAAGFVGDDPTAIERQFGRVQGYIYRAKDLSKLLSLSIDGPELAPELEMFTRGYARASMWELYADRHAGVCLLFDRERLETALEKELRKIGRTFHAPVRYETAGVAALPGGSTIILPTGEEPIADVIACHIDAHREALFFTKLADWEHEAEYRFVVVTDREGPVLVQYHDALSEVIVGHDFPDWQLPSARAACDTAGVTGRKLLWEMNRPIPIHLPRA